MTKRLFTQARQTGKRSLVEQLLTKAQRSATDPVTGELEPQRLYAAFEAQLRAHIPWVFETHPESPVGLAYTTTHIERGLHDHIGIPPPWQARVTRPAPTETKAMTDTHDMGELPEPSVHSDVTVAATTIAAIAPHATVQQSGHPTQVRFIEERFAALETTLADKIRDAYLTAATVGSAGIDLRYVGNEPLVLAPGETVNVPSGISIFLQDPTLVGKVYPRSGLGSKGLVIGNLTGIIDADYQGEIGLTLWNRNTVHADRLQEPERYRLEVEEKTFTLEPGERVVQYVAVRREILDFQVVDEFTEETERGAGGFGHSGRF